MPSAGIFILVDRALLIRDIQRRIDAQTWFIIPVWDDASREFAAEVQHRWFEEAPARDHFQTAVFGKAIVDGRGFTICLAAKHCIDLAGLNDLCETDTSKYTVLVRQNCPPAVLEWLHELFQWNWQSQN